MSKEIVEVIDAFQPVNPSFPRWYKNTTQRAATSRLITTHGLERILSVVSILHKTNTLQYVPTVTTPVQLEDKWAALAAALRKKKAEITKNIIAEI